LSNNQPHATTARITPAQLRLLADPLREHIVQSLATKPKTVATLAAELGCAPTRLYHHVERLLEARLLVTTGERKVRGVLERSYRTVAPRLLLDRTKFAAHGKRRAQGLQSILAYVLDQARAELEAAVARGAVDPQYEWPDARQLVAWRAVARVTPAEAEALRRKTRALYDEVDRLSRRAAPPEAQLISVALTLTPVDPVSQRNRRAPNARSTR
jgi:AraC-like DNA-binding protein